MTESGGAGPGPGESRTPSRKFGGIAAHCQWQPTPESEPDTAAGAAAAGRRRPGPDASSGEYYYYGE